MRSLVGTLSIVCLLLGAVNAQSNSLTQQHSNSGSYGITATTQAQDQQHHVDLAREIFISIPPLNAAEALNRFAKQTGIQMLYSYEQVFTRKARPVVGQYAVMDALTLLLKGSGLEVSLSSKGAITISDSEKVAQHNQRERINMNSKMNTKKTLLASMVGLFAAAGGASSAIAQGDEAATAQGRIDEITVTAQKRGEQSLREVPISISVLGGKDLDSGSFEGVNDALSQVAGLQLFDNQQGGSTKIAVRGVTSNTSLFNGGAVVGYYLDDVPFGFIKFPASPDASAFDMDRVEVLRGPQGTLYGASALNGVVRVLTKGANLDEVEFKARTSFSSTDGGGDNYRGDLAVNVPLIPGKLAVRGVVGYNDMSGWVDQPNNNTENANDAELKSYRLKVNAQPTENFSAELSTWVSRDDRGAASVSDDNGNTPVARDEPISTDYETYGLTLEYRFPTFTVTSTTSQIDFENVGVEDLLGDNGIVVTNIFAEVFAEEVRLTSTLDGPWQWTLGGMYRDAKDRLRQDVPVFWGDLSLDSQDESESIAVFGEVSRTFFDEQFELAVGLRYFKDDVESKELGRPGEEALASELISSEASFDSLTPRVVLTWLLNDDFTAYASYSQGFRSGFEPLPFYEVSGGFDIPSINEDLLTNYEIGAKGNTLDGRLQYEAALYYIDWEDTQQRRVVEVLDGAAEAFIPLNGEDVNGVGIDLSLSAALTEALTVGVTYSWNDLSFAADVVAVGTTIYEKGDRIDESAETTIGLTADYVFPLGVSGYQGRLSASANYHSELSVTDGRSGDTLFGDGILQSQLKLTVDAPEHWTTSLYVDNVTNEDGLVRPVPFNDYQYSRLRPRTVGLQFEYQY